MITNKHHQVLVDLFKSHQNILPNNAWVAHYVGTTKKLYQLKTGDSKNLVKTYLKSVDLTFPDFQELLLSLSDGSSFEELSSMGKIMELYPKYRHDLSPKIVDKFFDHVGGWAEVDVTCCFSADDMLDNWPEWEKLLTGFNVDTNIHKRRASLVLLTQPLRLSPDPRFYKLALKNVEKLKSEKDILITKAISWVLRSMIKFHPDIVREYLEKNKDSLPRIAVREATTKLLTGKKYINKKKANAHQN
jgi:3-methyladenine DNA glycosylase AlkD